MQQLVLQLCANFYKNYVINDTNIKFHELLEDIISKYFRYSDISDSSNIVFNLKNCTFRYCMQLRRVICIS